MSRPLRERIPEQLKNALPAFLAGFGLSLLGLSALFGGTDWLTVAAACGGTALTLCLLWALSPRAAGILLIAGLLGLGLGCVNIGPLAAPAQGLRIFWLYPDILASALPPFRALLSVLLPIVVSAVCAVIALSETPTLTLLPMAIFSIVFGTRLLGSMTAAALAGIGACTAAFFLSLARERTRLTAAPLLITGCAVALSLLLLPRTPPAAPVLRQAAEEVYQTVTDYLPSSDDSARSGFTLQTEGYLPLGGEARPRLGGPADPTDRTVMEVSTAYPLYLRGTVMNHYTGLNWEDTLSGRRYLYADLLQQAYRRSLFDEYLPLTTGQLRLESASVHMLSRAATTLYLPQRLRSIEGRSAHMTPYFNAGSEVFLPRELEAGDGYAFTYLRLPADSAETARLVDEGAAARDAHWQEVAQLYTAVPAYLQGALSQLSYTAAGGEETPYRRALAIRDYLRENYVYSLDVPTPPDDVDFASWFLLRERRGYCTYFATALTVLCRLQGIPARYVTGYLAVPENGLATVTSADAHAWTEVYLNGFGWLTLDATPGDRFDQAKDEPPNESGATPPDAETPPEQTPTPEPLPDETPEPEAGETPEPPTPTPVPLPSEAPPAAPDAPKGPSVLLWLIFIALALAAALLAFTVWMDPLRRAKRKPRQAAQILTAACDTALARLFRSRRADETLLQYAAAAETRFPGLPLRDLAEARSAQTYGRHSLSPALPRAVWLGLQEQLSLPQRIACIFHL